MNQSDCNKVIKTIRGEGKIGDVLEKMREKGIDQRQLLQYWWLLGYAKSLQEVIKCGFEETEHFICNGCGSQDCACYCGVACMEGGTTSVKIQQLKDPNAGELFEFLNTIFNG